MKKNYPHQHRSIRVETTVGMLLGVKACRYRTQCGCHLITALCTKSEDSHLQCNKAFDRDSERTFGDVLHSKITSRDGLRLRARAATNFYRSSLAVSRTLVHMSLCGTYSLKFSDMLSDVTCAVVQTPAETHYNVASYSQLVE